MLTIMRFGLRYKNKIGSIAGGPVVSKSAWKVARACDKGHHAYDNSNIPKRFSSLAKASVLFSDFGLRLDPPHWDFVLHDSLVS